MSTPIKVIVKPNPTQIVYPTGSTIGANIGVGTGVYKLKDNNTLEFKSLSGGSNVTIVDGDTIVINSNVDTSNLVEKSTYSGYTATTNLNISNIENDIIYISGQTDLKLNISDFNTYSGVTKTNLNDLGSDLNSVSAQTNTNTSNILNNDADIAFISGVTNTNSNNITSNSSNISSLSAQTINKLDSVVAGTNVTVDNTDPKNPIVSASVNTSGFVTSSTFNTYTGDTNTQLNNIENDISYLSGQTDLKLEISDFNIYSGNTASDLSTISADLTALSGDVATNTTSISDNAADIAYLSGETDSKLAISDFNTYSGNTKNDIDYISGQTDLKADKNPEIVSLTTTTTLDATYDGKIIECDGTFTVTLPDGMATGMRVDIVNVGSGTITLAASTTLQSEGTLLETQYTGAAAYHRGSNVWIALGKLTS